MGTHFWGFETQDIIPDMVTLGKLLHFLLGVENYGSLTLRVAIGGHLLDTSLPACSVVMDCAGKPIGNGFPMGAVIMTPTLANAFNNGEQYFATCGGCTAAGAAGVRYLHFGFSAVALSPARATFVKFSD